jgi:hypothetical protein
MWLPSIIRFGRSGGRRPQNLGFCLLDADSRRALQLLTAEPGIGTRSKSQVPAAKLDRCGRSANKYGGDLFNPNSKEKKGENHEGQDECQGRSSARSVLRFGRRAASPFWGEGDSRPSLQARSARRQLAGLLASAACDQVASGLFLVRITSTAKQSFERIVPKQEFGNKFIVWSRLRRARLVFVVKEKGR